VTLPLIYALNQATDRERKAIKRIFSRSRKDGQQVREIISFVRDKKGLEYANAKMHEIKDEALGILEGYSPDNPGYSALVGLVEYTVNRNK